MGKYTISNNQRGFTSLYQKGTAFDDAGVRNRRVMKRTKQAKKAKDTAWFQQKRKEAIAQEKSVMLALRSKDNAALAIIATTVAFACLDMP